MVFGRWVAVKEGEMVFVLHVAVVEGTSGLAGMLVEGERSWGIAE